MFAALNQKNKSVSCFGCKLFRPRPEYYSVWLQCKVPVYQTLSASLNAMANDDSLSEISLRFRHHTSLRFAFGEKKRRKEKKKEKPLSAERGALSVCAQINNEC